MTETSVDPVEEARLAFVASARRAFESGLDVDQEAAAGAQNEWCAAILASDPRVQALEAVARAAQGVGGGAECEQRGAEFKQPSWCATHPQELWPCPYTELSAALAALQEETGEDGAIQG